MSEQRPSVLFVDDEPNLLAGVRRSLHKLSKQWDMTFVSSGTEALQVLASRPFHALVTDMRMPGMDGGELLAQAQQLYPATARIVLSGEAERDAVIAAAATAHQFLAKPCDSDELVAVIARVLDVQNAVTDPELRRIIAGTSHLPTLPTVYYELTRLMSSPDVRVEAVADVLASDVATSAEVLKLTNSAFFGMPRRIETVSDAVRMLGLDNIQALVAAGSTFRAEGCPAGVDTNRLRMDALRRSAMIRKAGQQLGWHLRDITPIALGGMLRDIGELVLARGRPDRAISLAAQITSDPLRCADPECMAGLQREAYGCTVPQASAHLLALWGFSPLVVRTVAGQPAPLSDPGASPGEILLTLVHRVILRQQPPDEATDEPLIPDVTEICSAMTSGCELRLPVD